MWTNGKFCHVLSATVLTAYEVENSEEAGDHRVRKKRVERIVAAGELALSTL